MKSDSIQLVREYVRTVARQIKKEQKEKLREEMKLRRHVRRLINEVEEVSPHTSTGINVLEDLLKTIIPIIEVGYKRLTSSKQQRKSYRAHIIRALQNLLSTESVYFNADKKSKKGGTPQLATAGGAPLEEQDEEMDVKNDAEAGVEKDPAFIDIEKDKKKKDTQETQPKPEDAFEEIPGEDPTGKGFALRTFNKIKNQTLDSFSLLGLKPDKEIFYDFLITNAKLYFDKFEDELQNDLEEPTTPEYEAEKQKKQQSLGNASATVPVPSPEAGGVPPATDDQEEEAGGEELAAAEEEELEIELDEDLEEEEEEEEEEEQEDD